MPSFFLSPLTRRRTRPPLPERIHAIVRKQQVSSERLIGQVQLGVVLVFGTLYAIAPKPTGGDALMPVPWALAAYVLFTLLRLWLVHRGRLPGVVVYLSCAVDMALLFGLIWSFHIQYHQPPTFYLKAPTLWYVFLFIALRALRFEARYLVATGVLAALGWLFLLVYAIGGDFHNPAITGDYVRYLTSNSVLLGGEFDKIITLLAVTAILALAMHRAHRLLVSSVTESSTAMILARFLPMGVAQRLAQAAEAPVAGQGELKPATILFIDLEGFTGLSEAVAPDTLINTLNDYFAAVVEPIERHGGVVEQFIGDAVMATFNLPEPCPEHAAAALCAAMEIQALLQTRRFGADELTLRARIGINSGVVVGGLVGAGSRLAYSVYGDAVNLAARLEPLNKEVRTSWSPRRPAIWPAPMPSRSAPWAWSRCADGAAPPRSTPWRPGPIGSLPEEEGVPP
ncbi:MAG TPA: adenylate/guanylate cyclase domain-containing protein [Candidatus Competibacteraceae bacterium]|nr:adenylate/guanylate cyclase domain-containing protein [Candidatus Competibacteraceae bacterium]